MNLMENINSEITNAMKNRNTFNLSVLRMLKSSIQLEKISKKKELSDEEIMAVIKKQVKVRKESMAEYAKYDKTEQVNSLKEEINLLSKYLPTELSSTEIDKIIDQAFAEVNPESNKDIGLVMKKVSQLLNGQGDMKLVSELVRSRLEK